MTRSKDLNCSVVSLELALDLRKALMKRSVHEILERRTEGLS